MLAPMLAGAIPPRLFVRRRPHGRSSENPRFN